MLGTTGWNVLAIGLAVCALSFSVATGVDYVRLDRARAEVTAGIDVVPEGATLLPLMFKRAKTSEFTASLTHAWGYYAIAKDTSAPLVFAVERSYPDANPRATRQRHAGLLFELDPEARQYAMHQSTVSIGQVTFPNTGPGQRNVMGALTSRGFGRTIVSGFRHGLWSPPRRLCSIR